MHRKGIQQFVKLTADSEGNPPSRIHLMSTGHWHAPWHGNFEMTSADLLAMVANFNAGIGVVADSGKLPVNYGHDMTGKAAGWITALTVENGSELWGDVTWTKEGARMLREGEFRYISPEWNPRSYPYQDPEDEDSWVDNVFTGAGLTNIPLFKKLKPIMASLVPSKAEQVTTVSSDKRKGETSMDLAALRAKKREELSEDELAFVTEHQADLTTEERKAFDLQTDEDKEAEAQAQAEADARAKEAADKAAAAEDETNLKAAAQVLGISASALKKLHADAAAGREAQQELLKTRLTASVTKHIGRGAIKSDQADTAVKILMASSENQRKELLAFMAALPTNKIAASGEIGKSGEEEDDVEVTEEEKALAADFGNTPEQIAEYKKSLKANK